MRIPLAGVLIAGGLVGLAWPAIAPGPEDAAVPGETAVEGETVLPVIADTTPEPVWGASVTLDREPDGHFYANVVLDGTTTRMLVDTGASVIALTGDDAAAIGLTWSPDEVVPVAQGASGVVYGINTVLPRVRLGDFEARDVPAMVIPEGLPISLLGQSFLSTVRSARIEEDRMVLEN